MVTRKQKLIAAAAVLAAGFAMAMLFPRICTNDVPNARVPVAAPPAPSAATAPVLAADALNGHFSPHQSTPATPAANIALSAIMVPAPATPFDQLETITPIDEPAAGGGRPVYAPLVDSPPAGQTSPYRIHVVHDGDTLERLAERYLGDDARALELFDLNRDVLENPHLLTIGAELRIPALVPPAE